VNAVDQPVGIVRIIEIEVGEADDFRLPFLSEGRGCARKQDGHKGERNEARHVDLHRIAPPGCISNKCFRAQFRYSAWN
jgi:hypothetical protein